MVWALHIGLLLLSTALVSECERLSFEKGVMVNLMEWKYEDIAHECEDFLQPLEFAAVLISPPNENIVKPKHPWSERYQPVSYKLITRSGDEEQLKNMLRRCNDVGVRVVAEVILNNMAGDDDNCVGTGKSKCNSKDFHYPAVPYEYDDFHHSGKINCYKDAQMIRNCELDGKHDLDQSRPNVQDIQTKFLNHLISIGIAGFKINAAKHMEPGDLTAILGKLDNLKGDYNFLPDTKPFVYLEMIDNDKEPVSYKEYIHLGLVTDYKYGNQLGLHILPINNGLKINNLKKFGESPKWNLIPSDQSIVFVDSHDTQHGNLFPNHINFQQSKYYKIAVAFMLAWNWGTPVLMSSYRFTNKEDGPPSDENGNIVSPKIESNICDKNIGWVCEHRWREIFNMVEFHNVVKGTEIKEWWDQDNQIAFCRGDKGFISLNMGTLPYKGTRQTCLHEGTYCDVIGGKLKADGTCSGAEVVVKSNGEAYIEVPEVTPQKDGGILAIHIESRKGLIKKPKKYVAPKYKIPETGIQPQQDSLPQHGAPKQGTHTAYFKGDYDIFEQGNMIEIGFHRGYENVETTLKLKVSQDWLADLLFNPVKTQQ